MFTYACTQIAEIREQITIENLEEDGIRRERSKADEIRKVKAFNI